MDSQVSATSLFGGDRPWSPLDWTSSDDRVRGGSSYSELSCHPSSPKARFHGNLDIETLGGAGFASQRTTGEDKVWDLSTYNGILLDIEEADNMQYTFILKDELLLKSPNGREQSTISWEYDFVASKNGDKVLVNWKDLKPTYRGKEKNDVEPLNLKSIKRISLMVRSFFGKQSGPFSLSIASISAVSNSRKIYDRYHDDPTTTHQEEKSYLKSHEAPPQGWAAWLFGGCVVS